MNDLVAQVKRMSGSPRSAPPRRSEPSASARWATRRCSSTRW